MEPIAISQGEALLIGVCLGEYEIRKRSEPDLSFLRISNSRLDPFVPALTQGGWTRINEKDIPADVEWFPLSEVRSGRSPSHPNFLFGIDDEGAYQKKLDFSRRNLHQLLTSYMLDHLGMDEEMRQWTRNQVGDHLDAAKEIASLYEIMLSRDILDTASDGVRGESDDVEGIKQAIQELMRHNRFERPFEIGRNFGKVVGALEGYEEDFSSLLFMANFILPMRELYNLPEIEDSTFASSALRKVSAFFEEEFGEFKLFGENMGLIKEIMKQKREAPDGDEFMKGILEAMKPTREASGDDDSKGADELEGDEKTEAQRRRRIMPRIYQARTIVWVAFGDVLGFVRQFPDDEENSEPLTHRPFQLMKNDSPDRIRQAIYIAERELCRPAKGDNSPERVINSLANAIEGLTKRLWEKDYNDKVKRGFGGLPGLYMDKLKSCEILERRFASAALSLLTTYRNPANHEIDSFQCTYTEARYFVAGVRMLWELHETIKKRAPGSS